MEICTENNMNVDDLVGNHSSMLRRSNKQRNINWTKKKAMSYQKKQIEGIETFTKIPNSGGNTEKAALAISVKASNVVWQSGHCSSSITLKSIKTLRLCKERVQSEILLNN